MTTKLSNDLLSGNPAYRNRLINPSLVINQRGTGTVTMSTTPTYIGDGWHVYYNAGTGNCSATIGTSAGLQAPNLKQYMVFTVLTTRSFTTSDIAYVSQYIEGYKLDDLNWGTANAQPLTLSFWARSSAAGTLSGSIQNLISSRSYSFNYTINTGGVWEYKTVVIPPDTSNTIPTGTNAALRVYFSIGAGATYLTSSLGWNPSLYLGGTGVTGIMATASRTLYLAGMQVEVGGSASPFEFRPYEKELVDCQRYYYRQQATATSQPFYVPINAIGAASANAPIRFPVPMRIAPTALEQSGTAGNYGVIFLGSITACSSVPTFGTATTVGATTVLTVTSGLTGGQAGQLVSSAASGTSAYLGWSAEFI